VHASSQGTQAAAWAPRSNRGAAQQGLSVHASSKGTRAAAWVARSDRGAAQQAARACELVAAGAARSDCEAA